MTRRSRTYEESSDADAVRFIASKHGLKPQVDMDGPTHAVLAQVNQSDLAFLRERARAVDAEVWVEGDTLHAQARARRNAGKVSLEYGRTLREGELAYGYFVAPTVVDDLPKQHALFREELFLPLVCLAGVDSLEEALNWANNTEYGLTAGFFSQDPAEVDAFLEKIEAGVVYVNRRAGATTGAWPGVQPFGGWKGSGSSGKASGGLYYVQQFMREQSRTIVR